MTDLVAAQNVFGPSTLVLTTLVMILVLLTIRSYVHQLNIKTTRSSLFLLDAAIIFVTVVYFALVYLRFRYLS